MPEVKTSTVRNSTAVVELSPRSSLKRRLVNGLRAIAVNDVVNGPVAAGPPTADSSLTKRLVSD
jgi:hypothetical protein